VPPQSKPVLHHGAGGKTSKLGEDDAGWPSDVEEETSSDGEEEMSWHDICDLALTIGPNGNLQHRDWQDYDDKCEPL